MVDDLYREICRCPEDDTLRLAYADWLDENGDPDRAEFVRCQVDWGRGRNEDRAYSLLVAHAEWSRLTCEACEGTGVIDQGCHCPTCHGMGGLFLPRDEWAPGHVHHVPRTVTFARGFPDSVSCTLSEAFATDGTPTPWACEVVRRTPVTRFVLTDRRPEVTPSFPGWRGWYTGTHSQSIPAALFEYLEGEHPEFRDGGTAVAPLWRTDAEALGALAVAAGRLVRWHVYGEVTA